MGTIFTTSGFPGAVSAASGGKIYAYNNISSTPQQVAPANPNRQSVTFSNPGSNDIYIAPAFVVNSGSQVALVPTPSALGGCFKVFSGGGQITFVGECQGAWQAFANTGSTNALTVMDSNT